ncbi:hypothetical protein [Catellatospora sichuanensis]|uniref:hypothetical protein n=1 Tax=Catellatospora sichuanensis TaxID=1969805 RepID=UPI0011845FD4|nr:hypothetical protein [Catellatospora sichuanensis]
MNELAPSSYRLIETLLANAETTHHGRPTANPKGFEDLTDSQVIMMVNQLQDMHILISQWGDDFPFSITLTGNGLARAQEYRTNRTNKRTRLQACRSHLLAWAYDQADATDPDPEGFLADERAWFYGWKFSDSDFRSSVQYLVQLGLLKTSVVPTLGPEGIDSYIHYLLTAAGVRCVEEFDCDVVKFNNHQDGRQGRVTVAIGTMIGSNFAAAGGDQSHLTQGVSGTVDIEQTRQWADSVSTVLPVLCVPADRISELEQTVAELKAATAEPVPQQSRVAAAFGKTLQVLTALVTVSDAAGLIQMLIDQGAALALGG